MRGYSYDRRDVTGRGLANAYAQTLGTIFSSGGEKPYEVEIVVAEVGDTADDDQIYRLTYDGSGRRRARLRRDGRRRRGRRDRTSRSTTPRTPRSRDALHVGRRGARATARRDRRDARPGDPGRATSRSPCSTAPAPQPRKFRRLGPALALLESLLRRPRPHRARRAAARRDGTRRRRRAESGPDQPPTEPGDARRRRREMRPAARRRRAVRRRVTGQPRLTVVDRRIFGIENEYGVTCTFKGQRRLSPDEVARYLFRKVVSWGRSSQRLPAQRRPALPRRRQPPGVRHARVRRHRRAGHPRQGGGAGPRGPAR